MADLPTLERFTVGEPFALHAARGAVEGGTRQFGHAALGTFELFVSPVGAVDNCVQHYEVVIDRSVPLPPDPAARKPEPAGAATPTPAAPPPTSSPPATTAPAPRSRARLKRRRKTRSKRAAAAARRAWRAWLRRRPAWPRR
jgi:type IV secretory pathway VirB10-like protein